MTPLLRAGTAADIDAVLALWKHAEAGPSSTESADHMRRLLGRDPDALLLADAEGRSSAR